jgi:hypothetical protein
MSKPDPAAQNSLHQHALDAFTDGVWFVDLARLSTLRIPR